MRRSFICALVASGLLTLTASAQDADVIMTGARVWTGDSTARFAEAVAIRGERILAVGSAQEVMRHRGARTRVLDQRGRFIVPGFIDNHTHFESAGALLLGANLLDVADEAGLVRRVREARDRVGAGTWLVGGDWGAYESWAQGSTGREGEAARAVFRPHRAMLDSITPDTPLLLNRWDRTAWLANAQALRLAGASCEWEGVECEAGAPTGRLTTEAAMRVRQAIPVKPMAQRLAESRAALAHLAALGVTQIHDNTPPDQMRVFQVLHRAGELTTRIYARPTLDKWDELRAVGIESGFGDDWLMIGGLKGFVDGIMGNSSAHFYEPYLTTGVRGSWRDSTNTAAQSGAGSGMEPPSNMRRLLYGADSAGLWPQVHAIGDQAIDTLITLMEEVMRVNGPKERRWRIIHTQVIRDASVAQRMAKAGLIAEVQPYHAIDDMRWMEERIGERSRWAYAFRTLRDAGVLLSFGSDWPGTNASWYTANPMHGIYAAVTRQTLDGNPAGGWFPEERVDVETALRAYTVNNAWAAGQEDRKGRLAPGMLADIVVLDADPFQVQPERLKDVRVLLTMVGGRVVHEAKPGSPAALR